MRPEVPLRPGETVVWTGVPDPAVIFAPGDFFLIPFSVFFVAFSAFWVSNVAASSAALPFVLFGAAFVLFGLYFAVGRFFAKAWRKRRTVYAITNKRALSVVGGSTREAMLPSASLTTNRSRDGRHLSVTFEVAGGGSRWGFNPAVTLYRDSGLDFFEQDAGTVSFFDVEDVHGLQAGLDRIQTRTD
jgi:hypothetical protein